MERVKISKKTCQDETKYGPTSYGDTHMIVSDPEDGEITINLIHRPGEG